MKALTRRQGVPRPAEAKALSGLRRAAHYEAGGEVAGWLGSSRKFENRKREAARKACRKGTY